MFDAFAATARNRNNDRLGDFLFYCSRAIIHGVIQSRHGGIDISINLAQVADRAAIPWHACSLRYGSSFEKRLKNPRSFRPLRASTAAHTLAWAARIDG